MFRSAVLLLFSVLNSQLSVGYAQPAGVRLDTLRVQHVDFEGRTQQGVIICNHTIAGDLRDIFAELYRQRYPIERIRLIDDYGADDERSMRDNNTSCFCFRTVSGTKKLSKHARGLAVDVNTLYNPYVHTARDGRRLIEPSTAAAYADRKRSFPYKIIKGDLLHRLFIQHGFTWGGSWRSMKDWQHFEK